MAVRFDAAESYQRNLSLGSQSVFTFAMYARLRANRSVSTCLWSFDDTTDAGVFGFRTTTDGASLRLYDAAAGGSVVTGPTLSVNTWFFLCAVVDASITSGTFYWRTASAANLTSGTWTAGARTITTLYIGDDRFANEWFNGNIAGFQLWTAALSAAEVANESRQIKPIRTANLQAFYPFTRTETADYSGNGNTLTGGATTATEDGPPVSWYGAVPRIIIGTAVAATNASAEHAAYSVTANDPAPSIVVNAECATVAVAASDPAASVQPAALDAAIGLVVDDQAGSVVPVGELAALTVPAADVVGTVAPAGELAALTVAAADPAGLVSPVGDVAGLVVLSGDGTGQPAPETELATLTVVANDPVVAVPGDLLGDVAAFSLSAEDASVSSVDQVTVNAEANAFTLAGENASGSVSLGSEPTAITLTADDATVSTSVNATVTAEALAFGVSGNDASVVIAADATVNAEVATFGLSAFDPAPSLGVIALNGAMTFDGFDLSSLVAFASEQALITLTADDAYIGRQGGTMTTGDRPFTTIDSAHRPFQTHTGVDRDIQQVATVVRNLSTMSGGT